MNREVSTALVVGAGISGIRSALDLALIGHPVILIDKAPHIGGTLIQLDRQFPSDACGMCRMLPMAERDEAAQYCLRRGFSHENIEILLSTELAALEGEPGEFRATLHRKPTWVDPERCIGCGECSRVCPVAAPDSFNAGLTLRKAISQPIPYSNAHGYVVDTDACTRCGDCEKVCPTNAVDLSGRSRVMQVEVGAVILAAGVESFDPAASKYADGYALPNVITSVEFERLISETGPNRGTLLRPSDGQPVKRAAWFQCVGSRDHQVGADYCSGACCMYSIKEAMLAKMQSDDQVAATIFYMDMRTFGKNFQRYRDHAEKQHGIRFQRSRVHSIIPTGSTGDLKVQYLDDHGNMVEEVFDLIVLATGQSPSAGAGSLAETTRIALNPWSFFQPIPFSMTRTSREGVFASGSFGGLRDISESVIQASAAALTASGFLRARDVRLGETQQPQTTFRDVSWELPKVDVDIGKVKTTVPPAIASTGINNTALVVGGGIAGMTAALAIANHGFPVHLVEQAGELGGNLRLRHHTLDGHRPEALLAETIAKVKDHPDIHVQKNARVIESRGSLGRFATTIKKKDGTAETIGHGITILATGGLEATTQSYGYGTSERIVTQGEFEQMLNDETVIPVDLSSVAMIQCVDSREEPRNYCSRVCCASALKNALFLKKNHPDINIYVFYRDLMSYGFMETYYTQARRAGVVFVPYSVNNKPRVTVENGKPILTGMDPVLQRQLEIRTDLLVLSTGIVPGNSGKLAEIFGVEVDEDGFFQEAESKWRPVDTLKRGIFVCGLAHSPRNIAETVAMAEAAALRGLRFLTRAHLSAGTGTVAAVDEGRCTGCKTCVDLCAYRAISFREERKSAVIDAMLCQGCGVCAAACPVASISVWNYTPDQMYAQIEDVLTG